MLTDGQSNYQSEECGGGTEHVAKYIHDNHSHILVFAVGIGDRINTDELSLIASRNHLVTKLGQYNQVNVMKPILHYEICYTRMSRHALASMSSM